MEMTIDTHGNRIKERYSVILTDPTFENRLKAFDPNLRLCFDQLKKRWTVLEKAYVGPGFNAILTAEDEEGNAKPLGDWVFNKLFVFRERWKQKAQMGADKWFESLVSEAESQQEKIEERASDNDQALLREDITQWRKASKELQGLPASDATAGYRKI